MVHLTRAIGLMLSMLICGSQSWGQTVCHLVLVGDTNDPSIGGSVSVDLSNFAGVFEDNVVQQQLRITTLRAEDVSEQKILDAIRSVQQQMANNDAIIVYYSGHGAYTEGTGQFVQLPGNVPLYRSTLLSVLNERPVRLRALITDTCSVVMRKLADMAPAMAAEETQLMATSPAFISLCLNSAGVVDISASSKGEVAMGDTLFGGYFTHNFVSFLREKKDEQLTWPVLINNVRVRTREYFIREQPDGVDNPFIPERTQRTQTVDGQFQGVGSDSSTMPTEGPRFGVLAVTAPGGVVVKEVVPNSPATRVFLAEIGQTVALEVGDLITHINGIPIQGEEGYGALIDASSKQMTLTLVNVRDGKAYSGSVELAR